MSLWFRPICDQLLAKLQIWTRTYERGEVYATRQFCSPDGQVVDKPVGFSHRVPLSTREMYYLIQIFESLRPESDILPELRQIKLMVERGKGQLLPGGYKLVTINLYKQVIEEIAGVMLEARDGKPKTFEDYREPGKDLFQI